MVADTVDAPTTLLETPLTALHRALGAKMAPFAGYDMPIQYADGVMAEHRWTREKAGLFDVSHMGQGALVGPDHAAVAAAFEALTPGEFQALKPGRLRYTVLLNDEGGIIDDLIVARPADGAPILGFVANAARKAVDFPYIAERLPEGVTLETASTRALLALQGPAAAGVADALFPGVADLTFMTTGAPVTVAGAEAYVTRSGYTGEDGFELSVAGADARRVAETLLDHPDVKPIGLGARDSLRLEAGLCLYGSDMDETTSPIEADLAFAVSKRRREEGGFPGADRVRRELADGPSRKRVGLRLMEKAPARAGAVVLMDGAEVGRVTSGGFAPTLGAPIAMATVDADACQVGTRLDLVVRGAPRPAEVVPTPFVPHRYRR